MSQNNKLKICYLGDDLNYWRKLTQRFQSTYSNDDFNFIHLKDDASKTAEDLFVEIVKAKYNVLYVDLSSLAHRKLNLCKYLTKDGVTKTLPTVALHTKNDSKTYIKRALLAGVRINHIKCNEIHDVIYNALSFLDVNRTVKPDYVTAEYKFKTFLYQDLRITYTTDEYFHIETNSPLIEGEKILLEEHFLHKIMKTKFFYIKNGKTSNLYYNTRYSFDIYFTYCDDPYDEIIENTKENEETPEGVFDYHNIITKMEKNELAQKQLYIKKKIKKWIVNHRGKNIPKKIKILAIDRKLELFQKLSKEEKSFPFNINIQTQLGGNQYQIKRILPHFIVYNMDLFKDSKEDSSKINGIISLKKIIDAVEKIDDYDPIIIVFQNPAFTWDINSTFNYPKLISNNIELDLDIIKKLGEATKKKLSNVDDQDNDRVYFKASDDESITVFKREIEIISMTESILYFTCGTKIPDWTVFSIKDPVQMLITVVPHKSDGAFASESGVYRALINGTGEVEKQNVRTFINNLVEESNKAADS